MKAAEVKDGALFIGNSDEVAEKINTVKEMFGLTQLHCAYGCWRTQSRSDDEKY